MFYPTYKLARTGFSGRVSGRKYGRFLSFLVIEGQEIARPWHQKVLSNPFRGNEDNGTTFGLTKGRNVFIPDYCVAGKVLKILFMSL